MTPKAYNDGSFLGLHALSLPVTGNRPWYFRPQQPNSWAYEQQLPASVDKEQAFLGP